MEEGYPAETIAVAEAPYHGITTAMSISDVLTIVALAIVEAFRRRKDLPYISRIYINSFLTVVEIHSFY